MFMGKKTHYFKMPFPPIGSVDLMQSQSKSQQFFFNQLIVSKVHGER